MLPPSAGTVKSNSFINTVQRRWSKKTVAKRREVLISTSPTMPSTHRPDVKAWVANKLSDRAAFLLPHLNLEDLCELQPLLLMLQSRASRSPSLFASGDLSATRLAWAIGIVRFTDAQQRVTFWDDDPAYIKLRDDNEESKLACCVDWEQAQIILEAQEQLYRLLHSTGHQGHTTRHSSQQPHIKREVSSSARHYRQKSSERRVGGSGPATD